MNIDDQLLRAAKKNAVETGRTLTAVIEDALRQALANGRRSGQVPPLKLPTLHLGGTLPGVDLDSSAALLELMDQGDGPV